MNNITKKNPKALGTLAAAGTAAAIVGSGGAAAPAVLGAAGTGASLGALGFGMAGPGELGQGRGGNPAIERRVQQLQGSNVDPQATMKQAIFALREANNPELTKAYAPVLTQGLIKTVGS